MKFVDRRSKWLLSFSQDSLLEAFNIVLTGNYVVSVHLQILHKHMREPWGKRMRKYLTFPAAEIKFPMRGGVISAHSCSVRTEKSGSRRQLVTWHPQPGRREWWHRRSAVLSSPRLQTPPTQTWHHSHWELSLPSASSREFFTVCPEAETLDIPLECLQVCLHGDSRFSDDGNQ